MVMDRETRSPDSTGNKKTKGFNNENNSVGKSIITPKYNGWRFIVKSTLKVE
jgi:hypothetical protein